VGDKASHFFGAGERRQAKTVFCPWGSNKPGGTTRAKDRRTGRVFVLGEGGKGHAMHQGNEVGAGSCFFFRFGERLPPLPFSGGVPTVVQVNPRTP